MRLPGRTTEFAGSTTISAPKGDKIDFQIVAARYNGRREFGVDLARAETCFDADHLNVLPPSHR